MRGRLSISLGIRPRLGSTACDGVSWDLKTKGKTKPSWPGSKACELGNISCTYLGHG